jgi:protein gp37
MTDAFARFVPDGWMDQMLAVAAETERHTYQFLTKRADRALKYFSDSSLEDRLTNIWQGRGEGRETWNLMLPLKNVWLGTSVEDQKTADERIPLLLETPAAVRWVSYEPALGPVDLRNLRDGTFNALDGIDYEDIGDIRDAGIFSKNGVLGLNWLVCGGESGPNARGFDIAWARSIIAQCKAAGVAVFMKQIGSRPVSTQKEQRPWEPLFHDAHGRQPTGEYAIVLKDKKGGDWNEWPEDLRVREFPEAR